MAKVRFEEIVPGTASLRAAYDAERRGLIAQIACWWALAAFGVIITVATFVVSLSFGSIAMSGIDRRCAAVWPGR